MSCIMAHPPECVGRHRRLAHRMRGSHLRVARERRLQRLEPRIGRRPPPCRAGSRRRRDLAPEVARDRMPVVRRRAAASSSAHRGRACGQRVRKRQPDGGSARARHVAFEQDARAASRAGSGTGIADSSACVYGWRGAANSARLSAYSTIRPEVHHRDARGDELDDREIVRDEDVRQAEPRCRSRRRLTTCAWIETSSAETGSSQTMSRGSTASARAMPMRCRWPPENSCG